MPEQQAGTGRRGVASPIGGVVGWLFAPATEAPRAQQGGLTVLRVLLGLMWLYNVVWKNAPGFGDADSGLYKFTAFAVSHPVFPPFSWVVEHVVLPHIQIFGWGVLVVETALAVLLLTGTFVRLAGALGVAQSLAIGLSVAAAPPEWPWSYWLMIGAHLVILLGPAGRAFGVDGARDGSGSFRRLGTIWGALVIVVGLYSVLVSFDDPFAANGPSLGLPGLSVSLGGYNLLGGLVLVAVGALVLGATLGPARAHLGAVAAALAALAGVSLHVQLALNTEPFLGGSETSAAFYFSVGVVGVALDRLSRHRGRAAAETDATAPTSGKR